MRIHGAKNESRSTILQLYFGKTQRVKTQRVKTSENFAEEKMFAEDISEDFSDITFTLDFKVFLDIFEIFAEDCFLLRRFRKFLPSGFLPLSRFQIFSGECKALIFPRV